MTSESPISHSARRSVGWFLVLAFLWMILFPWRPAAAAPTDPRNLTLEERLRYQRAIEEVNWQYRIWPKENPQPMPALEAVLPLSAMRAKVEDDLRKSKALEVYWQRPVTGAQLQAEMTRMARATQQPERLRALWAALGDDPFLIAECLARPALVNRLLRSWYAGDSRWHGELRQQAQGELARTGTLQDLRKLSGAYEEVEWVSQEDAEAAPAAERMAETLASARRAGGDGLPVGVVSGLQEREDGYHVLVVLEQAARRMRVATVT